MVFAIYLSCACFSHFQMHLKGKKVKIHLCSISTAKYTKRNRKIIDKFHFVVTIVMHIKQYIIQLRLTMGHHFNKNTLNKNEMDTIVRFRFTFQIGLIHFDDTLIFFYSPISYSHVPFSPLSFHWKRCHLELQYFSVCITG